MRATSNRISGTEVSLVGWRVFTFSVNKNGERRRRFLVRRMKTRERDKPLLFFDFPINYRRRWSSAYIFHEIHRRFHRSSFPVGQTGRGRYFFTTALRFRILTTPRAWSDLKPPMAETEMDLIAIVDTCHVYLLETLSYYGIPSARRMSCPKYNHYR